MKFSIFSPTHRPTQILDAYDSLRLQGHQDWEWVIVPNNGIREEDIPEPIRRDSRVVIRPYSHKNIGALKRFACDQTTGDALVELDHDDLLLPGTLKRLEACYATGAGFVYSDAAGFNEKNGRAHKYAPEYGWESYPVRVYNRLFFATRTFDICPRMLCSVHYAPDHVRTWSREAYYKAGGHNKDLLVADDHDLVCRTYLAQVPFMHTGGCNYLYRFHENNSVGVYYKDISRITKENQDKYMWQLIDEWVRRERLVHADLSADHDYAQPLPWATDSVACLKVWDYLQTVPAEALGAFLNECYRVIRPGGWLCLKCPETSSPAAWMPSHKSYWNEEVIRCLTEKPQALRHLRSYQGRFQTVRCWTACYRDAGRSRELPSVFADLFCLKGQRTPGRCFI